MSDEPTLAQIIERLDRLRSDVMDRLDRLQNSNNDIRDDIAVSLNYGIADKAQRANDNTRDEVRALAEVQSAMHRQISRLQAQVRELRGEP